MEKLKRIHISKNLKLQIGAVGDFPRMLDDHAWPRYDEALCARIVINGWKNGFGGQKDVVADGRTNGCGSLVDVLRWAY